MLTIPPGGDRRSRSAENYFEPGLGHGVYDTIHPGVLKVSVFRLPQTPGRLAHSYDRESSFPHQLDIFAQSLVGHVLVIIGSTVENIRKAAWGGRFSSLIGCCREGGRAGKQ